jgi:hypothetical protein
MHLRDLLVPFGLSALHGLVMIDRGDVRGRKTWGTS